MFPIRVVQGEPVDLAGSRSVARAITAEKRLATEARAPLGKTGVLSKYQPYLPLRHTSYVGRCWDFWRQQFKI